jgi:hypothetical protein
MFEEIPKAELDTRPLMVERHHRSKGIGRKPAHTSAPVHLIEHLNLLCKIGSERAVLIRRQRL